MKIDTLTAFKYQGKLPQQGRIFRRPLRTTYARKTLFLQISLSKGKAHFASRKALRFIGISMMASVACHRTIAAVRIPGLERSPWLIALLFMRTISIAPLTVFRLLLIQAGSTADGSQLICLVHLKERLAPAAGSGHLNHGLARCALKKA